MRSLIITVARVAAWLLTVAIIALSLVPSWLRPGTDLPHNFEHLSIFFAAGVAFGVGYCRRPNFVMVMLVIFSGAIELAQIVVPSRHARLSDFIIDAAAAIFGVAIAFFAATQRLNKRARSISPDESEPFVDKHFP
jgi:VanZ family protein